MNAVLHQEPYRHYKMENPETGKTTWNGAGGVRIASVTDVLDGAADALTGWAIGNTLVAAETAAVRYLGCGPDLARSILDFGQLAELTGCMPYTLRDAKADLGTLAHSYFGAALAGPPFPDEDYITVPYGYRAAIVDWIMQEQPVVVQDDKGPRVERAVGDFDRAVAGTYDAQLVLGPDLGDCFTHRVDLKTSRSVQPKHFAQVAEYEREAQLCGEDPSDYCTILHVDPLHGVKAYSIEVGGADYVRALAVFDSYLAVRRGESALAKLLKSC